MIAYSSEFDDYRSQVEKESKPVILNPPWQEICDVAQGRTMKVFMKAAVFIVKHKRQIGLIVGSILTICGYDFGDEVVRYSTTWS